MKTLLLLILVSVAIPQTTRDRVITLEAEVKNLNEKITELKEDHKSVQNDLNQYYYEIYVKGNKRHKEHEEKISSSKVNAYGTMIGVAVVFILQTFGFVHLKRNGKAVKP